MASIRGKNQVNLDALIPRADLFEGSDLEIADLHSLKIIDLEPGVIYDLLRKPDFQRETCNWSPQQVAQLIKTFSVSEIIPAIILWQNGNKIFVIDGAHRLSALVAWACDDYGAGSLSQKFFKGKIPSHQASIDEQTRDLVNASVGPWENHKKTVLSMREIQVQWIKNSNSAQAAEAFIRINKGGTEIDPLETRILRSGRSALAISTRVISRGGVGHEYWRHFSDEKALTLIPKLGAQIYKLLYSPPLEMPIKSADVPLGGYGYGPSVLRFAFDLVANSNDLPIQDSTRKDVKDNFVQDNTGLETVKFLQKTKRTVQLILSNEPLSLGLHPALYFYTGGGTFQPTALQNMIAWALQLEKRGKLIQFLRVRGTFENLILEHPAIVKPPIHAFGSGSRTRPKMIAVLDRVLDLLAQNPDPLAAWKKITREFPHLLKDDKEEKEKFEAGGAGKPFGRGSKSAATLSELANVARCAVCSGLLHANGKVADHKEKKSKGGTSAGKNARWIHPVCNSSREKLNEQAA